MESQNLQLSNAKEAQELIASETAVALYFSSARCTVCHALLPKIKDLFLEHFPIVKFIHVPIEETPDIPAAFGVFTAPTLLVFLEGKEYLRKAQNMGLKEVYDQIERPYRLMTT